MTSSGRNYGYDARLQPPHRDSGSEYSDSTCCCMSCASSCSGSESSDRDDDAYLSDCSACRARRNALRRGRSEWSDGDGGYTGLGHRAEVRDQVRRDYRRHSHRYERQHRHGETGQRGQQNSGHSSRNNNPNISTNTNTNTYNTTPAYCTLAERILATTRRLRQDEENLRHFRTWIRVLEDVQRRSQVNPGSNSSAIPTAPAARRTSQGSSSSATAVGRMSNASSRAAAGEEALRQTQVYPRGARGYFMSGGRSISTSRRRRV